MLRPRWWERMYVDAVKYSKNCPECAVALGRGRSGPPLQPIPVSHVFQIVDVNIMDLPKTERGNKHVLNFLFKWQMVFPMPDQKMHRIVKHLTEGYSCCLVFLRPFIRPWD